MKNKRIIVLNLNYVINKEKSLLINIIMMEHGKNSQNNMNKKKKKYIMLGLVV